MPNPEHDTHRNRLDESASLYLRQHADNPVHWWPWTDEALAAARDQNKPILLSVGYSACHWCHVMAHESFEDEATAAVMNRHFINIKVDREERPDLDQVYQLSHQLLTGRGGGWPLTAVLDPETLTPFFAGTYFPPEPRHGMPSFTDLLERIATYYSSHGDEINQQNSQLQAAIQSIGQSDGNTSDLPGPEVFSQANQAFLSAYDPQHGGLGSAPKFPQAPALAWLSGQRDPTNAVQSALMHTLNSLAAGGCYDHLGGGFFRYCVDGHWGIPHFEKMLYDNALLLPILAREAARAPDQAPLWTRACAETVHWLQREMQHDAGGFHASIDADSEEGEGAFYVWTPAQVDELLDDSVVDEFQQAFGLNQPANFEGEFWHLDRRRGERQPQPDWQPPPLSESTVTATRALRQQRNTRPAPTTDTKVMAHWNGLTVAGLARAGLSLDEPEWVVAAQANMSALQDRLWDGEKLWRLKPENHPPVAATLDDYAALLDACVALSQHPGDQQWLHWASALGQRLLEDFEDTDHGGLFLTAHDQPMPISRLKPMQDDATPAGNGLACRSLIVLGHALGKTAWLDTASNLLKAASRDIQRSPRAHATLLSALQEWHHPRPTVVLFGADQSLDSWRSVARSGNARLFPVGNNPADLPGILANYSFEPEKDEAKAWLCLGSRCLPPVNTAAELAGQIEKT